MSFLHPLREGECVEGRNGDGEVIESQLTGFYAVVGAERYDARKSKENASMIAWGSSGGERANRCVTRKSTEHLAASHGFPKYNLHTYPTWEDLRSAQNLT